MHGLSSRNQIFRFGFWSRNSDRTETKTSPIISRISRKNQNSKKMNSSVLVRRIGSNSVLVFSCLVFGFRSRNSDRTKTKPSQISLGFWVINLVWAICRPLLHINCKDLKKKQFSWGFLDYACLRWQLLQSNNTSKWLNVRKRL